MGCRAPAVEQGAQFGMGPSERCEPVRSSDQGSQGGLAHEVLKTEALREGVLEE